ncbi:hypothetical protein [Flavobacterium sp. NRK F7]|uniref:hypothetical protein n=1 Tax=Flavobacterium sp. NRK F7 TaxID=2954930 RepID=UPI00208FFF18|nr:hypothetical protein [Flavobacterium sp. NRK F7]MCO6164065.1 hypothetical protein [Flavobacterium sp. NRK F7]
MLKKGCIIIFMLFVLTVSIFIGVFFLNQSDKTKKAEIDEIKLSKICDTIKAITEQPTITFDEFKTNELERINFYLIRENKIIEEKETFIPEYSSSDGTYKTFKIPFEYFLKTDTIIVKTSTLYFKIPNFHHYAYLHFGNFGYLGSSDCRIEKNKYIYIEDRIENYKLPTKARR